MIGMGHKGKSWRLGRWLGLGAVLVLPIWCWRSLQVQIGRDLPLSRCPIAGLPKSATHISYAFGGMGPVTLYEFDTNEADFQTWAQSNGWALSPITKNDRGELWRMTRYGHGTGAGDRDDPQETQILDGCRYEWVNPSSPDDRLTVAYDRYGHRAYYYRSFR